jgi:hypothetical protein
MEGIAEDVNEKADLLRLFFKCFFSHPFQLVLSQNASLPIADLVSDSSGVLAACLCNCETCGLDSMGGSIRPRSVLVFSHQGPFSRHRRMVAGIESLHENLPMSD